METKIGISFSSVPGLHQNEIFEGLATVSLPSTCKPTANILSQTFQRFVPAVRCVSFKPLTTRSVNI